MNAYKDRNAAISARPKVTALPISHLISSPITSQMLAAAGIVSSSTLPCFQIITSQMERCVRL